MAMLLPYERLIGTPVMSLQTGTELARTKSILVDPRNLTVLGYELEGPLLDSHPSFLRVPDVRELSNLGFIVDSSEEFVSLDDVIKIQEVYEFNFNIIGTEVRDEKGKKLGKTHSYTIDADSFVVQQLNVRRPLFKSLGDTELLIHRSQIVKVRDHEIIVKAGDARSPVKETLREYANPFRQQNAQAESVDIDQS